MSVTRSPDCRPCRLSRGCIALTASRVSQVPGRALYSFEDADDYVYDVRWSPANPSLFAAVDGTGAVSLWNPAQDSEVCVCVLVRVASRAAPDPSATVALHRYPLRRSE